MSSSKTPPKKFVHNGQIVDTIPLTIRIRRGFREFCNILILYLFTLFSFNPREAAKSFAAKNNQQSSLAARNGKLK